MRSLLHGTLLQDSATRVGQEELYSQLEHILTTLKQYSPYAIPFLVKVCKRDVPDYHLVIKSPMDLTTMSKKLKNLQYNSKLEFKNDIQLIVDNCFCYNTQPVRAPEDVARAEYHGCRSKLG